MEVLKDPKYLVRVSNTTLKKFRYIVATGLKEEFSVYMECTRDGNVMTLSNWILPKQIGTSVTVEVDGEDLMEEIISSGVDIENVRGHVHYHPNMSVRPSAQDIIETKEMGINGDFNASLIINEKGEMFCHVADTMNNIYIQDVPIEVIYDYEGEDEFFESKISAIKKAAEKILSSNDFKEIEELSEKIEAYKNYSIDKFSEEFCPLTKEIVEELDGDIRFKLKGKYTPMYTTKKYGIPGYKTPAYWKVSNTKKAINHQGRGNFKY